MADNDDTRDKNNKVGYGKPPSRTQFVKGQSGNPKGRPKGSQNLATILTKVSRELVKVIENGRTRYITKFQATMLQLVNKAVSGDLNAARELRSWFTSLAIAPEADPAEGKDPIQDLVDEMRKESARIGKPEGHIELEEQIELEEEET
jgi:hypothetical protein